jgi:3-hydroxy-9,10-secoandrosta-1,3,5(10)-triene-9,17-dione monooxygenase
LNIAGVDTRFAREDESMTTPLCEQASQSLLQHAHRIAAKLPARAAETRHSRRLSEDTIRELKQAGLLRLLQPKQWGGLEADPQLFIDVQNVLAEKCVSTAWVCGVLGVQSFMLALFDARAQRDVWGEDGAALASSSFQPQGSAERVDGGFRLGGQWPYSSGCLHADWANVGALVPSASGGAPEMRLFLVPRKDYEIVDTWDTFGLRGTGSNDIRISGAFVPEYRTVKPDPGIVPASRSGCEATLYRMPWLFMFTSSVAALGIGAARGALAAFWDALRARMANSSSKVDPAAVQTAARTGLEIEAIDATLRASVARLTQCARSREDMTMQEALEHRLQLTSIVRRCSMLVDGLMPYLGARSVFLDNSFTRSWLDLCAARAHPGNDPSATSNDLGRILAQPPPR